MFSETDFGLQVYTHVHHTFRLVQQDGNTEEESEQKVQ